MHSDESAYLFALEVQHLDTYAEVPSVEAIVDYIDRLFAFTTPEGRHNNCASMKMALTDLLRCRDAQVVVRHDSVDKSTLVPLEVGLAYGHRGSIVFREVSVNLADSGSLPFLNGPDGDGRAQFELRIQPRPGQRPLANIGFRLASENRPIDPIPHFLGVRPLLEACAAASGLGIGLLQDRLLRSVCLRRRPLIEHGLPCSELGIPSEMLTLRFGIFFGETPNEVWKPCAIAIDPFRAPAWYSALHRPLMLGALTEVRPDGPFDIIESTAVPPVRDRQPLIAYEHEETPDTL